MKCSACGDVISPAQGTCVSCGQAPHRQCPFCASDVAPKANYCSNCGEALGGPQYKAVSPLHALKSSIPDEIATRILKSKSLLQGERKQASILFADISNSTSLIDHLDPEQALQAIAPTLKKMMDVVHQSDGFVNRIQGDGIMALFGAPLALEDHASRACHAALEIQDIVNAHADDGINVRIGIHSGEVVLHSIANGLYFNLDAAGQAVNLAARIEQQVPPRKIYLSADTAQQAGGLINVVSIGQHTLRGSAIPVQLYELIGRSEHKTRWEGRVSGGLTPFVGRNSEMALLEKAYSTALTGRGQVIVISGHAGVGKSRLVHQFIEGQGGGECTVLKGAGASHGRNVAYLLLADMLRPLFNLSPSQSGPEASAAYHDSFNDAFSALHRYEAPLKSLLGLPVDSTSWKEMDSLSRRRLIREAVCALLTTLAETKPVVLLCEDLQWADAESRAILLKLAEMSAASPILVVVTNREELSEDLRQGIASLPNSSTIHLEALPHQASATFLNTLLGESAELSALKAIVMERANGVPLYFEEIVRMLIDSGVLRGTFGNYVIDEQPSGISIPDSVHSVVADRIDRLLAEQKALLQIAAVTGKHGPIALLQTVSGQSDDDFRRNFHALQQADFLSKAAGLDDNEYRFFHDLTRQTAYNSILSEQRTVLHAAIAGAMEDLFEEDREGHLERLAQHAYDGAIWEKAARYFLAAAQSALTRSFNREALRLCDQGQTAARNANPSRDVTGIAIDLRLRAAAACLPLGEKERVVASLDEACALAARIDDEQRLAASENQKAVALWMNGQHTEALKTVKKANFTATSLQHPGLQFATAFTTGMVLHAFGNFEQAIGVHTQLLDYLTEDVDRKTAGWTGLPSVLLRTFLASSNIETGNFAEAERHIKAGMSTADERMNPYSQCTVYDFRGQYLLEIGDPDGAVDVLEKALSICNEFEILTLYPSIVSRLGLAYAETGRLDEAIPLLEEARDTARYEASGKYVWAWLFLALGRAYFLAKRYDEARGAIWRAADLAQYSGEKAHWAHALKFLGDVSEAAEPANTERRVALYLQALALAEECGMKPLIAGCHLGLSLAYREKEDEDGARAEAQQSADLYTEMGLRDRADEATRITQSLTRYGARGHIRLVH